MNFTVGLKGDFEANMWDNYLRCKEKWGLFLFCLCGVSFCSLCVAEVLWKVHILEGAFVVSVDEEHYCAGQLVSESFSERVNTCQI